MQIVGNAIVRSVVLDRWRRIVEQCLRFGAKGHAFEVKFDTALRSGQHDRIPQGPHATEFNDPCGTAGYRDAGDRLGLYAAGAVVTQTVRSQRSEPPCQQIEHVHAGVGQDAAAGDGLVPVGGRCRVGRQTATKARVEPEDRPEASGLQERSHTLRARCEPQVRTRERTRADSDDFGIHASPCGCGEDLGPAQHRFGGRGELGQFAGAADSDSGDDRRVESIEILRSPLRDRGASGKSSRRYEIGIDAQRRAYSETPQCRTEGRRCRAASNQRDSSRPQGRRSIRHARCRASVGPALLHRCVPSRQARVTEKSAPRRHAAARSQQGARAGRRHRRPRGLARRAPQRRR